MSRLNSTRPAGDGELLAASDLLFDGGGRALGRRIRLNPGGGEYEAVIMAVSLQETPAGWVRIAHTRDGYAKPTINVVPPSAEIRVVR